MNNNNQPQTMTQNQLKLLQKNISDKVFNRITELKETAGLTIAPNYAPQNALRSAFYALENAPKGSLLEKCTPDSIANSLLEMVIQGLSPAKNQCYFIPYNNKCTLRRSYFGDQKVIKSSGAVKKINATVVYEGDEFAYDIVDGEKIVRTHKSCVENQDNPVRAVYATLTLPDGTKINEVMSKKELEASWSQGSTGQAVHKKFPQEMAKKTVIRRAAKNYINTSDDSDILVETFNKTSANEFGAEYEDERIDKANAIDVEIKEQANAQEFVDEDIPQVPYANYEPTDAPQQAWPQGQQASQQVQQASQQAQAQPVVQPTPTSESQSQEVMWNL